jgi:hypothetical protein
VVLAVGILIASMVTAQSRAAEPYAVEPLTGAAEVPGPGDPDGAGTASLTIDVDTDQVCLTVSTLTNVDPLTAGHIHNNVAGASGPVVVDFGVSGNTAPFTLCVTDTDADSVAANPAGFYVNLHTAEFAAGAVRGQLVAPVAGTETPTSTEGTPAESTPTATEGTPAESTATATIEETVAATPTTSVPVPGDLVVNGGFENGLTGWTLKNSLGGDKVKTNKTDKTYAYEGSSAFKFKGSVGAKAAIQQVPDISALTFGVNDTLDVSIAVNAKKESAAGKVKVVAKYADGNGDKATIDLGTTNNVYEVLTGQAILTQATVTKIKIQVKNTSPDGKIYVDAISVVLVDQPDPTATATVEETVAATETATVEGTVAATATATETEAAALVPLP